MEVSFDEVRLSLATLEIASGVRSQFLLVPCPPTTDSIALDVMV